MDKKESENRNYHYEEENSRLSRIVRKEQDKNNDLLKEIRRLKGFNRDLEE